MKKMIGPPFQSIATITWEEVADCTNEQRCRYNELSIRSDYGDLISDEIKELEALSEYKFKVKVNIQSIELINPEPPDPTRARTLPISYKITHHHLISVCEAINKIIKVAETKTITLSEEAEQV